MNQGGKNAAKWTRLSCHDFVDNQVRLQLFTLGTTVTLYASYEATARNWLNTRE